jgi:uncharacterized membrane protein
LILAFALSFYAYPVVPDEVATHWDAGGDVNGSMSREWGLFIAPAIMLGLLGLFYLMPKIDPLRGNIRGFQAVYETFIAAFSVFMLFLHAQVILWNIGIKVGFNHTMPVMLGGLFYVVGGMMEKSKRNWFIGARTPWTLSSDGVWDKTNKLGGRLFKACAIISLAGVAAVDYWVYLVIVPVLASSLYLSPYSYLEYRKLEASK